MNSLSGKVAIVTGCASHPGIGRSTAVALARAGARVLATDIDETGLFTCVDDILERGGQATGARHDVASEADWVRVVELAVTEYGGLDILVNNAGIAVLKPLDELTLDDWNQQISVGLTSVFLGCKYAAEAMKVGQGGTLINISSVAGLVGSPRCTAYGAAKGGIRLMSKSIALDLARFNIRCNTVHPGIIRTPMQARARGSNRVEDVRVAADRVPLARVGTAEDIAHCILYLASDQASYVTGAEFTVDAGMTAR